MSKFHKNAIITGCIDSYCLVCETHLWSEEDARNHIEKPVHKKNLNSAQYLESHNDDHIRKVKKGYFCEFCNLLFTMVAKAILHISDAKHITNKGSKLLHRVGNSVILANNAFLSEKAWNGIIDNTCALCNAEFFDEQIHKTEPKHILNLVQKEIVFCADGNTYRKIDNSSFQCLICNMIALGTVTAHFVGDDHKKNLARSREFQPPRPSEVKYSSKEIHNVAAPNGGVIKKNADKNCNMKGTKTNTAKCIKVYATTSRKGNKNTKAENNREEDKQELKNQTDKQKILDNVSDFQKNGININFEMQTAFCKTCIVNLDFDSEAIKIHIEDHKNKPNIMATTPFTPTVDPNFSTTVLKNDNDNKDNKEQLNKIDENHNIKKDDGRKTTLKSENDADKFVDKTAIANGPAQNLNDNYSNKALVTYSSSTNSKTTNDKTTKPLTKEESKDSALVDDPVRFAKENHLTYNKGNNNAYCRLCESRLPSNLLGMKEHVAGAGHRIRATKSVFNKRNIPKKSMEIFIKSRTVIRDVCLGQHDVVVNDKYCLTKLSYLMITQHESRLRCQVCEMNLMESDVDEHMETRTHEIALDVTPVVSCLDSEFVREVRPGLYHCGFCNLIAGCWDDLKKHLTCEEHRSNRSEASRRLRDHMPGIRLHREMREAQLMLMMRHFFF